MAASGYTPISLYYSSTAAATPTAGNLVNGELAINITDGKLYYKDNAGVVQVIADKAGTGVKTISFGTTGLTPSTATNGAVTVAGTLITSNGGTGLSSYTAGDLMYYASGTALSKLAIGTANYVLTSSGTAPQWVAASSIAVGAAGSNTQVQYNNSGVLGASSNFTFDGTNIGLAGGTANGVAYLNGSKVLTTGSALTFNGSILNLNAGANARFYRGDNARFGSVYYDNNGLNIQANSNGDNIYLNAVGTGGQMVFSVVNTEQMRLTSTGLGIGTSSPSRKLDVATTAADNFVKVNTTGAYNSGIEFANSGVVYGQIYFNNVSPYNLSILQQYSTGSLVFGTNNTERMRLDSSGNLGLGVTPSAWGSAYKAIDFVSRGSLGSTTATGDFDLIGNAYYNGTNWIYRNTAAASIFRQNDGAFKWFTAPSGTAGTAISFTQAMTLDASGNLGIGTSSPVSDAKLTISSPTTESYVFFQRTNSGVFDTAVGNNGGSLVFKGGADSSTVAGLTEFMRIDSSGNVLVGTTSAGSTGISISNSYNYTVVEGANSSLFNLFRQASSGATVIANGYKQSANANAFASSYGSSWAKTAISLGTAAGAITFYTDAAATTAVGTDVTPTERMRIDSSGNVGIGTSSPSYRLDIRKSGEATIGVVNTTNSVSTLIGSATDTAYIGTFTNHPQTFYTNSTERMRIDSSGNLLVGTTTAGISNSLSTTIEKSGYDNSRITVNHSSGGSSNGSYFMQFGYGGSAIGTITQNSTTSVAYNTSSDYRLKENIQPMQNALEFVRKQRPVTYNWKADGSKGSGYIAHWMQEDGAGNCVTGEKDAVDKDGNPVYQGIDTSFMVAPLNAAIIELADLVDTQTKLIQELKAELDATKAEVAALKGN